LFQIDRAEIVVQADPFADDEVPIPQRA